MTKYLTLSYILILIYSINTNADMCDPQFWEDPSREDINSFLSQGEVGLGDNVQNSDALFEDCENGKKPIEIASETAGHSIITYLLCKIAVDAVLNETIPYLVSHFRDDHGGQFNIGLYVTVELPQMGEFKLKMQASPPNCATQVFTE